jgi:hypothetical protein
MYKSQSDQVERFISDQRQVDAVFLLDSLCWGLMELSHEDPAGEYRSLLEHFKNTYPASWERVISK